MVYWVFHLPEGRYEVDVREGPSAEAGGKIVSGPFAQFEKANHKATAMQALHDAVRELLQEFLGN